MHAPRLERLWDGTRQLEEVVAEPGDVAGVDRGAREEADVALEHAGVPAVAVGRSWGAYGAGADVVVWREVEGREESFRDLAELVHERSVDALCEGDPHVAAAAGAGLGHQVRDPDVVQPEAELAGVQIGPSVLGIEVEADEPVEAVIAGEHHGPRRRGALAGSRGTAAGELVGDAAVGVDGSDADAELWRQLAGQFPSCPHNGGQAGREFRT